MEYRRKHLAEKLGVTKQTISNILSKNSSRGENGQTLSKIYVKNSTRGGIYKTFSSNWMVASKV
jgi:hypothetical protein